MPACHAGGRGFESRPVRKKTRSFQSGFFVVPGNLMKIALDPGQLNTARAACRQAAAEFFGFLA